MKTLGIVGSTGAVGKKAIEIVLKRSLNLEIRAFSSYGGGREVSGIPVEELDAVPKNLDFAIFSAGSDVSRKWAKKFAESKIVCIDNTSAFRMEKNIPLIVPSVNFNDIGKGDFLISNPNCATIPVVMVLKSFKEKLTGFHAVTFQSVSGAGRRGIEALEKERIGGNFSSSPFSTKIFDNIIPLIGGLDETGNSQEETKLVNESRKILHRDDLKISAFCVRVPLGIGHSVVLNLEGENLSAEKVISYIKNDKDVIYKEVPTPQDIKDTDDVIAGRVKDERGYPGLVSLIVCADNLRVGAATNAVDILEKMIM
ncbi:aspartate-semialdehyde dehydrogenase [candidate division WOR-3 bacterium]|nr:aspartate-semialdehyde dehydrogenase [candidate division WOR-3 bacterium]